MSWVAGKLSETILNFQMTKHWACGKVSWTVDRNPLHPPSSAQKSLDAKSKRIIKCVDHEDAFRNALLLSSSAKFRLGLGRADEIQFVAAKPS